MKLAQAMKRGDDKVLAQVNLGAGRRKQELSLTFGGSDYNYHLSFSHDEAWDFIRSTLRVLAELSRPEERARSWSGDGQPKPWEVALTDLLTELDTYHEQYGKEWSHY